MGGGDDQGLVATADRGEADLHAEPGPVLADCLDLATVAHGSGRRRFEVRRPEALVADLLIAGHEDLHRSSHQLRLLVPEDFANLGVGVDDAARLVDDDDGRRDCIQDPLEPSLGLGQRDVLQFPRLPLDGVAQRPIDGVGEAPEVRLHDVVVRPGADRLDGHVLPDGARHDHQRQRRLQLAHDLDGAQPGEPGQHVVGHDEVPGLRSHEGRPKTRLAIDPAVADPAATGRHGAHEQDLVIGRVLDDEHPEHRLVAHGRVGGSLRTNQYAPIWSIVAWNAAKSTGLRM